MKKALLVFLCLLSIQVFYSSSSIAQITYSNNDVAVFYPNGYDSTQTQPSFAIQNEPAVSPGLPAGWRIQPAFYVNGSGKNSVSISCGKNIDFYGTGEVTGNFRRNNTSITLWNTDNYTYSKDSGRRLYQSYPCVYGVRADGTCFGVIADNTWKMTIDITDSTINFTSEGPKFRVLVFEEKTPQLAVQKIAVLTGKISLPALWTLGYQQCRYSYMTDTEVKSVADSFRTNQLPCDVIWMDIDYMDQYKVFTFSPTSFPDPIGLNDYLHNKKFKSVWMIDPGVKQQSGYVIYDLGTNGNHWVQTSGGVPYVGTVWPGNCVFPDFTRPETRTWWSGLYNGFMSNGMDGVWNDMNEPSVFNGPDGTMPTDNIHRGGGGLPQGSHLRYHNVFGRLMVQASRAGIMQANPTKRPFVLSRANFLGGQQFAATWTGDNSATTNNMQLSVPMILTMGLSGQPIVGADVTGYHGTCTTDLFEQWMALGTFYPFYRNHSEKGTNRREPWTFGTPAEQVARVALQRRYRLLPYLYTLAKESSVDGMPIMRPLFFADAKDANLRSQQQAFLLGDQLMIIPKWATNVKYPSGLWTSISLVGENSKYDTYQPDVRIKAGAVLPLGQIIQSTSDYTADSLTLITCLDENYKASGTVYSDAGDGYDYQNGNYSARSFSIKPFGPDSLIMHINVDSGNLSTATSKYKLGIVTANGTAYTNFTNSNVIKVAKSFIGEFPYNGSAKNIPGKIEAEDYDLGGQGIAYNDADSVNTPGKYRPTESVDLETCSEGGFDLAYIASGEWDRYTVNVTIPGTYTLSARVATGVSSKSFHVEMDGVNISGPILVPNTGSWQTFQTVNVTTPVLTAGIKTMRIVMDSSNFNINYLQFTIKQIISCPNETIPIIATTHAAGNTYQWQLNNGAGFADITNNFLYNNSNNDTLILNNATSDLYGNQYRCAVTNNGVTSYSSIYTLQFGVTWTGAVSTDWADPANWNCDQLPDANTDVLINSGLTNYPVVNNPAYCRSVYLDKDASLQVNTGQVLNIKGY